MQPTQTPSSLSSTDKSILSQVEQKRVGVVRGEEARVQAQALENLTYSEPWPQGSGWGV